RETRTWRRGRRDQAPRDQREQRADPGRSPETRKARPFGRALRTAGWKGLRADGLLGEVALHGRLAGEVDPALAIDLDDHHHDLVTDGHDVLDARHVVVGQLADPDKAFLAGQDLDERAERHDPGHGAQVQGADLDFAGQAL